MHLGSAGGFAGQRVEAGSGAATLGAEDGGHWPLPCLLVVLGWGQGAGRLGQAEARGTAVLMVGGVAVRR